MAVRISFWTVVKASVGRKRTHRMTSTALQLELLLWLPEGDKVSSNPKDRFCDPALQYLEYTSS